MKQGRRSKGAGTPAPRRGASGGARSKPPSEKQLEKLPRWACVAFASRCAQRTRPIFLFAWPDAPAEHVEALDRAILLAESAARLGRAPDSGHFAEVAVAITDASSDAADADADAACLAADTAIFAAACIVESPFASSAARHAASVASHAGLETVGINAASWYDLDLLRSMSAGANWTDDSPVDPDWCGPLWFAGPPKAWPIRAAPTDARQPDLRIDIVAPEGMERAEADRFDALVTGFIAALSARHASMGGTGLRLLDEGSRPIAPAGAVVPAHGGAATGSRRTAGPDETPRPDSKSVGSSPDGPRRPAWDHLPYSTLPSAAMRFTLGPRAPSAGAPIDADEERRRLAAVTHSALIAARRCGLILGSRWTSSPIESWSERAMGIVACSQKRMDTSARTVSRARGAVVSKERPSRVPRALLGVEITGRDAVQTRLERIANQLSRPGPPLGMAEMWQGLFYLSMTVVEPGAPADPVAPDRVKPPAGVGPDLPPPQRAEKATRRRRSAPSRE